MNRPMTSQMRKRYQATMGSSAMSRKTEDDAKRGDDRSEGNNETAAATRIAITEDDDADGHEDKGE